MTVNSASNVCDSRFACCPIGNENSGVGLTNQPTSTQRVNSGAVALSYSNHVIANVVRTGDGIHDLFSMCKSRAIENVGVHFAPPVALACIGGGMFTGLAEGAISLPGRLWDTGRRFASNTADDVGAAIAFLPFFAMEFAGYGQMGAGMVGPRASVPPPAEAAVFSGLRLSGNGGSVASIALVSQPAAVAVVSGTVEIGGAVAAVVGGDFGGPMETPRTVRMSGFFDRWFGKKDKTCPQVGGAATPRQKVSTRPAGVEKLEDLKDFPIPVEKYVVVELPDGSVVIRTCDSTDKHVKLVLSDEKVVGAGTYALQRKMRKIFLTGESTSFPTGEQGVARNMVTPSEIAFSDRAGLARVREIFRQKFGGDIEFVKGVVELNR